MLPQILISFNQIGFHSYIQLCSRVLTFNNQSLIWCLGGKMENGTTTLPYELGKDKLIVVRDVPALVCSQCGEVFIESPILKKVELLLDTVEKSGLTMGFLEYQEAA